MSIDLQPSQPRLRPRGNDPSTWIYMNDLLLSAEEIAEAEAFNREHRFDREARARMLECARFVRYFTGMYLATMDSPRGTVVLMADEEWTEEISEFMRTLPPELVTKVTFGRCHTPEELERMI